ncbi:hypothetical protein [Oerskovia flava]|uniref:hypothetical protein n=1 Tax=Oerskovia flava TaxID=2986422 RepID=UPI00224090C8|nr:hypothetical protein [Oerskovia sp. JB1-3-2]
MIRPQWEWVLLDTEGAALAAPTSPVFTTQFDAEQWLGESWRGLSAQGAVAARLLHDGSQATALIELRTG